MKHSVFNHCAGKEALPMSLQREIVDAVDAIQIRPTRRSATKLRNALLSGLKGMGWSGEVAVRKGSDISITSMKGKVGLCLQTGNMARMYADLMKLQALYLDDSIVAAAIVLPSKPLATILGSNIAQASRLERELEIFKKVYYVPTMIFSLE
jgi:hypothetical protein